jgi:hypothetical protein
MRPKLGSLTSPSTADNPADDCPYRECLSLAKTLSGANAFEIGDIEEEETEARNQAIRM